MCGPSTVEVRLRPDLEGAPAWAHVEVRTLVRQAEILAGWRDARFVAEEVASAEDGLLASQAINRALEESGDVGEVVRQLVGTSRLVLGPVTLREALAAHLGVRPEDVVDIRLMWRVSADVPEVARLMATDGDWGTVGEVYVPEALEAELRALPAEFVLVGLGAGIFPSIPHVGQRLQYTVAHGGQLWGGWVREAPQRRVVPAMVDRLTYRQEGARWRPVGGHGPELPAGLRQAVAQAAWCLMEMGEVVRYSEQESLLNRALGRRV